MFFLISNIICSTLGILVNRARNTAADKLEDGDTAKEKIRDVIIEDLNNIQAKIDGLSRKDLLASYCFLKEGVVTLNLALDEPEGDQSNKDNVQNGRSKTTEAISTRNRSNPGVLNEAIALSSAIQKLNDTSNGRTVSAKECFKAAREEATRAFCNEALSVPDRVMAAKLRVASKILECLQDTKAARASCMLFLENLNSLPTIGETISTYFKGGIKSWVYKDSRLEIVRSVISLNFAVSDFIARYSGESPDLKNWPRFRLTETETIHPLLLGPDVIREIFQPEQMQQPENQHISGIISRGCMNSKGQLLFVFEKSINILNRSGDIQSFCELKRATANLKGNDQLVKALTVDRHDNVFVVTCFKDSTDTRCACVLLAFDCRGNELYERLLDFIDIVVPENNNVPWQRCLYGLNCVANNDGHILFYVPQKDYLCVCDCDSSGNIKTRVPLRRQGDVGASYSDIHTLQCVTDQNDIVMCSGTRVVIITKEGHVKRSITVVHEVPRRDGLPKRTRDVRQALYNHTTSEIDVLVYNHDISSEKHPPWQILSYSKNSEVKCLLLPAKRSESIRMFLSRHFAGAAVLLHGLLDGKKAAVFMQ